jgi:hypothetical protein
MSFLVPTTDFASDAFFNAAVVQKGTGDCSVIER